MNRIVHGGGLSRLEWAALAVLALVGLANVPLPFTWDQSLFVMGAKSMSRGAVLYRDYWDTKQPGIFLFDLAGGSLFGFHEVGIHLFELLWQLSFALTLLLTLRRHFENRALAALAPLFAVGLYYAFADDAKLTQVEALVAFPFYLSLWAVLPDEAGTQPHAGRFLFSGLMGGVVMAFKLMFAPIVGAFWLLVFADALARRRIAFPRAILRMALPAAVGLAIPLAAMWAYFAANGAWGLVWWTWTQYPLQVISQAKGFRLGVLVEGVSWFVFRFGPLLPFAFVGLVASLRGARRLLGSAVAAWFVLALGIILSQRVSWWPYQYLLLIAPTGILAALGMDFLWAHAMAGMNPPPAKRFAYGTVSLTLILLGAIGAQGLKTLELARARFAITAAQRERFQSAVATQMPYALVRNEMAFLSEPGSVPGSLYVIGNPLFQYFSGREDAGTRNAAIMTRYMSAADWEGVTRRLAGQRPAYVFIEKQMVPILKERPNVVAPFFEWLNRRYAPLKQTDRGSWFLRLDADTQRP